MISEPLLMTKVSVGPQRPSQVARPRLTQLLQSHLSGHFILISAPAGFGKTSLLLDWVHQHNPAVAWVSLDPGDNDPAVFLSYVIAALQKTAPQLGLSALTLLRSPKLTNRQTLLISLLNDLMQMPQPLAIILDDYHVVTSTDVHEMVAFLIEHLPAHVTVVLSTRHDPPMALAKWRSKELLLEIRAADLAFQNTESEQLLNEQLQLSLVAEDVHKLQERTEGWVTGLHLAALSLRACMDRAAFIHSFSSDDRYVGDYLFEEVIQQLPLEQQEFLLLTSILPRLCGPLCDAVAGRSGSQQILLALETANLFLFPLDNERHWFRYHPLFADLLRHRLLQLPQSQVAALYDRAGSWCLENHLTDEAIAYALAGKNYQTALTLLDAHAETKLTRNEIVSFKSWLDQIPQDFWRGHPLMWIYYAVASIYTGRPLLEAIQYMGEAEKADAEGRFAAERASVYALAAALSGEHDKSIEMAQGALDALPPQRFFFRSFIAGFLGINYFNAGRLQLAHASFSLAVELGRQTGNLFVTVLAQCYIAELCYQEGRLQHALEAYDRAYQWALDGRKRPTAIAGYARIGQGHIYYERNDLSAAAAAFDEGIALVKGWGEIGALSGYIGVAKIRFIQGDFSRARNKLQQAREAAARFEPMEMDDAAVACHAARWSIASGDLAGAQGWALSRHLDVHASAAQLYESFQLEKGFLRAREFITLARLFIGVDEPEKALQLLNLLEPCIQEAGWRPLGLELNALQIMALLHMDEGEQALGCLEPLLRDADRYGFMRLLLDEGPDLFNLIEQYAAAASCKSLPRALRTYVHGLLAAFHQQTTVKTLHETVEPLSDREREVLLLVADGLSNQEIAARLYISLNTVRSHTKSLFNKLEVHSRTQAMARAQELGLL